VTHSSEKERKYSEGRAVFFGAIVGGLCAVAASLASSWVQWGVAEDNRAEMVKIENKKIVNELNRIKLDEKVYDLESKKFKFEQELKKLQLKNILDIERVKAEDNAAQRNWELLRHNKEIELQNARSLASIWSSCVHATALVQQPVAYNGAVAGAPTSGGASSYPSRPEFARVEGGMSQGKDEIGCWSKIKELEQGEFIVEEFHQMVGQDN
tara:strand:- start:2390 stop:3022 length:633 start_codon:yes stop_codon:yes gene_type:complete